MKLKVVTVITDEQNYGFRNLKRSLRYFGYDYHAIVLKPEDWKEMGTKVVALRHLLTMLEDAQYTHVLFVDGYDTYFLASPEELMLKISWFCEGGLFMNAEKNCFPNHDLAKKHKDYGSPWRYVNSGAYISEIDYLRMIIDRHFTTPCPHDQNFFMEAYLQEFTSGLFELDFSCTIFQSLFDKKPGDFFYSPNGRLLNMRTGTMPIVIHGNGDAKNIMQPIYNLL